MDSVAAYSFGTFAWLGTQGLPLIIWPSFISSLLRTDFHRPSPLEEYYAQSLGFSLIALGLATVVLSGVIPLTSLPITETEVVSPYATSIILITSLHHAATSFYAYARYTRTPQTAFILASLASGTLAVFGLFTMLFAGDKSRRSNKYGFDKDTSSFPFTNEGSYRNKKKKVKGY